MSNGNGRDEEKTDPGLEPTEPIPKLLPDDATPKQTIDAINRLAFEWQMAAAAIRDLGKSVGALETELRERRLAKSRR